MNGLVRVLLVATMATMMGAVASGSCAASASDLVGVIIEGPEVTTEYCVLLDGEDVIGLDAIRDTGAELTIQDYGGGALTVCSIDGVGCVHPEQPCFCECEDPSGPCVFWGVYLLEEEGTWGFAPVGLNELTLEGGDVIGLRWAAQTPDGGAAPTGAAPDAVCTRATGVAAMRVSDGPARGTPWLLIALAIAAIGAAGIGLRRRST